MKRLLLTLALALLPCAALPQAVGNGAAGQVYVTPTIVQTTTCSAFAANATCTFGASPTTGNLLLFLVGGHNEVWTIPGPGLTTTQIVTPLTSYTATGSVQTTGGGAPNIVGTAEEVMAYYRIVQGSDPTAWVFGNSSDVIGVCAIEVSGAGGLSAQSLINPPKTASTTITTYGIPPVQVPAGGIAFSLFETDDSNGVTSIGSGWTQIGYIFPAGHNHASLCQRTTSAITTGLMAAQATWTNTLTNNYIPVETVTVFPK